MKLCCWGTRGLVATPGADTIEVGGNTTCYELRLGSGSPSLLIDCGSGAIEYASSLMARSAQPTAPPTGWEHHLLISHLHWDHILGFPFFHPIHVPGVRVNVYSAFPVEMLATHMEALFDGTYSPLRTIANLSAEVRFHHIPTDGATIAGARVTHHPVDHTSESVAFRIEHEGKVFGYVSDHEARDSDLNRAVVHFVRGADLLLHDAQYTREEYPNHQGYGHSSIEAALDNARRAGVRHVLLGHHDPKHTDAFLERYIATLEGYDAPPFGLACEGKVYDI